MHDGAEWVRWIAGTVLTVLVALATTAKVVAVWMRDLEKKVDRHHHSLYGPNEQNGVEADVKLLKAWKEDLRAGLPEKFRETVHDAANRVQKIILELEERITKLEARRR